MAAHPLAEAFFFERYNENHDPDNGQFSSGGGSGGGGGDSLSKDVGAKNGSGSGSKAAGGKDGGSKGPAVSGAAAQGQPRTYEGRSPRNDRGNGRLTGAKIAKIFAPTAEHNQSLTESGATPLTFNELGHGGAATFHKLISEAKQANKFGAAVTLYPEADYEHARLFASADGNVGFALKGDNIISVFKNPGSAAKEIVASILPLAVQEGGRRLDCFDTVLPDIYAKEGFRAVSRTPFDETYQPDGWDKGLFSKFNGGKPDVVFMVHDQNAQPYKAGDGKSFPSYDQAEAAQKAIAHAAEPIASNLFDKYHDSSATADDIVHSVEGAGAAIGEVERKLKDATPTNAPVDKGGFVGSDGKYTAERQALHDTILAELFSPEAVKAATPAAGDKPVMTLLGGRGGSGKSWFTSSGVADAQHAVYINADDIQAKLPGYQGWNAALYHDEASDITKMADEEARELGVSVIHDATLRTPGGSAKRTTDYKAAGYAVHGHYMFLPPQTSTKRAVQRFMRGGTEGRYVPASYLLNSTTNERSFDSLKPQFDKWSIYENTGASPKLVAASDEEKRDGRYSTRQVRARSRSARGRGQSLFAGVFEEAPRADRPPEGAAEEGLRALSGAFFFGRYNENHDPDNGQFASGGGSGGGGSVEPTPAASAPAPAVSAPAATKAEHSPKAENVVQLHPETINVSGDGWNKETARRLETEYQGAKPKLDEIVQNGIGDDVETHDSDDDEEEFSPGVPEEWDNLSGDQQEQAKEAYVSKNIDSWIESEQNNYFESGQALDDAKRTIVDDFDSGEADWAHDAVKDWLEERDEDDHTAAGKDVPYTAQQIVDALSLNYKDGYDGKGDFKVDFDNSALQDPNDKPDDLPGPGQETLPGIEPMKVDLSRHLTEAMRKEITDVITEAFDERADKKSGDMDVPEYITESAKENVENDWDDNLDDDSKFNWVKNNTDIIADAEKEAEAWAEEHGGTSGEVPDPSKFDVDPLNDTSGADYKATQRLAAYVSFERQRQIIDQRGIKGMSGALETVDIDDGDIKRIDKQLWEAWKGSSTSFGGRILQLATAEELGGRFREFQGNQPGPDGMPVASHRTDMIKQANTKYKEIGGYDGVKALVRAKWETSQYLLDKAGIHTLEVYRGMKVDLPANEKQDLVHPVNGNGQAKPYIRITDTKLLRNGAWSTTTDRGVANNWNAGSGDKIVLRIDAPRTAVISLPAYGVNVHSEKEVVLAGTAYKTWDAWKGTAPSFTEIPVGTPATKSMIDGKVEKIAA